MLLTPASLISYYVKLETDAYRALAAQDRSRLFLPVRAADCKVPTLMVGIKWIDAVSLSLDAAIDALAKALRAPVVSAMPAPTTLESAEDLVEQAQVLVEDAEALIEQSNSDEAIPLLEKATQLDPRSFEAWAHLGMAYNDTGRSGDSLAACERALALDDTQEWAWNGKGDALWGLKRYDEALAAYERALALDPYFTVAWNGKSNALDGLRRFEEALAAYDRALSSYHRFLPGLFVPALKNKAVTLRKLGRTAEAEAAERRAAELERNGSPRAHSPAPSCHIVLRIYQGM